MADKKKRNKQNRQKQRLRRSIMLLLSITTCLILILILWPRPEVSDTGQPPKDQRVVGYPEGPAEELPEAPVLPGGAAATREIEPPFPLARLALVIDDVGYSLRDLEAFLTLPQPITFAVLPGLPSSIEAAGLIRAAGKGLILHCPMEPLNGANAGPGVIRVGTDEQGVLEILGTNFTSVPEAAGMNNHMGSRATADEPLMRLVMGYLKDHGRFFLDSRTSSDTVAARVARELGVPVLERDIFIDNQRNSEYIRSSIDKGIEIALRKGSAILIGHAGTTEIADLLEEFAPYFEENGIELVTLPELMGLQTPNF